MTDTPTGSAPDAQPSAQTVKPAGLIERLEAAEVGSRELDAEIYQAMGFEVKHQTEWQDRWRFSRSYAFLRDGRWQAIAHLTTSFDAALAMAERELPGWTAWELSSRRGKTLFVAFFSKMENDDEERNETGRARTAPLALCIAILKATGEPQ